MRSLHSFVDSSGGGVAVRVWSGEYSEDSLTTILGGKRFKLINLPFYMVGNMENIIRAAV